MTTTQEMQASLDKLEINMDRFDSILNGSIGTVVPIDVGSVPSVARVMQTVENLFTYMFFNNRGAWAANTAYQINDMFSNSSVFYLVVSPFTSTNNVNTDIANGKVVVYQPREWVKLTSNVSQLRNYEPTFSSEVVILAGHTTLGVGGGPFIADLLDTTTADDDGVTIVTTGGKRWKRLLNGFVSSDMYGGDAKKVIQGVNKKNAIKLLSDYNLSSLIDLKSDTVLDCNGYTILPQGVQGTILRAEGSLGSYTALTANSLAGSDEIRTSLVLTVGQYIHVRSQTLFPAPNSRNGKYAQIFRITQVVSTGVYKIDRGVDRDFLTSASAEVCVATMKTNIEIRNLVVNNHNYSDSDLFNIGIVVRYCDNVQIHKPIFRGGRPKYSDTLNHLGKTAIVVSHSLNVTITDPQFYHTGSYGVDISGASHNVKVNGGYGYDTRHVVSVNWLVDGYGEPIDVWINDMIADHSDYSGFDTHDRGRNINFVRCVSRSSVRDSGFQQRNNECYFDSCVAYDNFLNGFVGRLITAQGQLKNCKAYKNKSDGFQYLTFGAVLDNCEAWGNISANADVSSGFIKGGKYYDGQYGVRIPGISSGDTPDLMPMTISDAYIPTYNSQTPIFISGITDYNPERLTLNSNKLYSDNETILVATPEGNKDKLPLTDGHNRTFLSSAQGKQKGIVTLSSGTATVTTEEILNFTGDNYSASSGLAILDNVRLKVRTPNNPGHLRYTISNKTSFTITSSNASDASVIEWEITGF